MTQPNLFNQPPELTESEKQAKRNQREEDRKRDYRIWLDSLSPEELNQFNYVFGNENFII